MFLKVGAKHFLLAIFISLMIPVSFEKPFSSASPPAIAQDIDQNDEKRQMYIGVNVRGEYTNLQHERYPNSVFPKNYYEDSFSLIRDSGMNLVRYLFYWEAYERNPELFIQELQTVARVADKYGIKVIYDNHQYQTSSWLDPKNGTGFPESLFQNTDDHIFDKGSGGKTHHESSKIWWTEWWDRSIEDTDGIDGWDLMADFLKKIVKTVDNHTSTLGYEILNEPQIHNDNQWEKVGEFNTFMVKELRELTQKTIVFSQQIPGSKHSDVIELTPENIAKMAPDNNNNTVFKFTLYRLPEPGGYHDDRFKTYLEAGKISGIPVMIGEWNNVERVKVEETDDDGNKIELYKVDAKSSDIDQRRATFFVDKFEKSSVWGWAYWNWNYIPNPVAPTNLLTVTPDGKIQPTKYLEVLKNAISEIYGEQTE
jgi:cellulase (glycosyl hydrolase family 5)